MNENKPKPPVVRAMQSWHWRCPDCGQVNMCQRSRTHEDTCWSCGGKFTVAIVHGVDSVAAASALCGLEVG